MFIISQTLFPTPFSTSTPILRAHDRGIRSSFLTLLLHHIKHRRTRDRGAADYALLFFSRSLPHSLPPLARHSCQLRRICKFVLHLFFLNLLYNSPRHLFLLIPLAVHHSCKKRARAHFPHSRANSNRSPLIPAAEESRCYIQNSSVASAPFRRINAVTLLVRTVIPHSLGLSRANFLSC